jgi:hypothetical protein
MPGKYLHVGCKMKCSLCQAEVTVPAPQNQVLKVGGNAVLLQTDLFTMAGGAGMCLGPKQPPPAGPLPPCAPCVAPMALTWTAASLVTKVNTVPTLLQTSVGMFTNYLGVPTPLLIEDGMPPTPATSE